MRPYVRTTPESRQRICDLYKAGKTLPQIADETGFSAATVGNVVRAAGITGAGRTTGLRADSATEALVMSLYEQGVVWREIVERSGVSTHTVSAIVKRNGGEISRKKSLAPADWSRIVDLYLDGMDAPEIGRQFGCHSSMVYYVLQHSDIQRRQQIACGNPDYFREIDTPEKAYWLGFLGADGCVTGFNHGYPRLQVKLARKDRDHLVKLHAALKANRPIRDIQEHSLGKWRPVSVMAVYSPPLVAGLVKHGIVEKKTDILLPWDGPADLMPHYWRGLFDGDGSITINERGVHTQLLGSKPVALAFCAWANGIAGTKANATHKKATTASWCVQHGGTIKVLKLVRALYEDAPVVLDRKKALADLALHGKPLQAGLF